MYAIGGLEPDNKIRKKSTINGLTFIVSDRFSSRLRDSIIQWSEFVKYYNKHTNDIEMLEYVAKILNIDKRADLDTTSMLKLVKYIYKLPLKFHLVCLSKQFFLHEPMSYAIRGLFMTIKNHYEHVVKLFVETRNKYINDNKTGDQQNDMAKLIEHWSDVNMQNDYDTSSIVLFFINPPSESTSLDIKFTVKNVKSTDKLKSAVSKFKYPGFCMFEPKKRLDGLLGFPIEEFSHCLVDLGCKACLPNYGALETHIASILATDKHVAPDANDIKTESDESPPDTFDDIAKLRWYVDAILDKRKLLVSTAKKMEIYYMHKAEIFQQVASFLSSKLES